MTSPKLEGEGPDEKGPIVEIDAVFRTWAVVDDLRCFIREERQEQVETSRKKERSAAITNPTLHPG